MTAGTVSDVTILGATDKNNNAIHGTDTESTSIQDDVTGSSIAAPAGQGHGVATALYGLGEAVGGITASASRFSTNPGANPASTMVPTWAVGQATPGGTTCNTPGTIYSNTAGRSSTSVYVCTTGLTWQPIT